MSEKHHQPRGGAGPPNLRGTGWRVETSEAAILRRARGTPWKNVLTPSCQSTVSLACSSFECRSTMKSAKPPALGSTTSAAAMAPQLEESKVAVAPASEVKCTVMYTRYVIVWAKAAWKPHP
eukprot:SAG22_NODE_21_length_31784_cov_15.522897_12_plen_122_part_00